MIISLALSSSQDAQIAAIRRIPCKNILHGCVCIAGWAWWVLACPCTSRAAHTLCSAGVLRATLPSSLLIAAIARPAQVQIGLVCVKDATASAVAER